VKGVLNEFWETASTKYKVIVLTAMGLLAVGIILTIIGASSQNRGLSTASLPFIGLGLVLHLVGMFIRARAVRRRLKK
jgi:uncharacterized membrane protein